MRRAHFIVGFNNWGKTTIIYTLFNRARYMYGNAYPIVGLTSTTTRFLVESSSNDDVGSNWPRRVANRIGTRGEDLVCAMCPSMEQDNRFIELLADPVFDLFDEYHFFLLRYKWEHHAELLTSEIQHTFGTTRPNAFLHIIDEGNVPEIQRTAEKIRQILNVLNPLYP